MRLKPNGENALRMMMLFGKDLKMVPENTRHGLTPSMIQTPMPRRTAQCWKSKKWKVKNCGKVTTNEGRKPFETCKRLPKIDAVAENRRARMPPGTLGAETETDPGPPRQKTSAALFVLLLHATDQPSPERTRARATRARTARLMRVSAIMSLPGKRTL